MEQEEGELEGYSYPNEKISRHTSPKGHKGYHKHFFALTNSLSSKSTREEAVSG